MGTFYCDKCKAERRAGTCPWCNSPTRKYSWTFPAGFDGKHEKAPHGFRVFYDEQGQPVREEEY